MPRISEEESAAIRSRADIVDVISHYITVEHKGNRYTALCPFHDDHTPSLTITPSKGLYKCFVCSNGGDVFSFVQNFEKISFIESVSKVASLCGYQLSVDLTPEPKKPGDPHKEKLWAAMEEMVRFTEYQLDLPQGSEKKRYLETRGLDDAACKHFSIGYNPPGDAVYRFLSAKGYAARDLLDANVIRIYGASYADVFADRITFPIHDAAGNPVGFSARTTDPQNPSKYVNTAETDVFKKGELVYNAHRAKNEARRKGYLLLCEGVTDVIAFWRAGIENCVCTLGTSCTASQIEQLRFLSPNLVFCYDGDDAGQAATLRAGKMALDAGLNVAVVRNRTGHDPDEIIRQNGAEALHELSEKKLSWMEFVIEYYKSRMNLDSYLEKREFVEKVGAEIQRLKDPEEQRYFSNELNKLTGMQVHVEITPKPQEMSAPAGQARAPIGAEAAEKQILGLMMKSAEAIEDYKKELGFLNDSLHQKLALMILDKARERGEVDPVMLLDMTEDQQIRNLITDLINPDSYESLTYSSSLFHGLMCRVQYETAKKQADAIKEQLGLALNDDGRAILLNRYLECLNEMRRLIDDEHGKYE